MSLRWTKVSPLAVFSKTSLILKKARKSCAPVRSELGGLVPGRLFVLYMRALSRLSNSGRSQVSFARRSEAARCTPLISRLLISFILGRGVCPLALAAVRDWLSFGLETSLAGGSAVRRVSCLESWLNPG